VVILLNVQVNIGGTHWKYRADMNHFVLRRSYERNELLPHTHTDVGDSLDSPLNNPEARLKGHRYRGMVFD
jgi:hypothetical protein